MGKNMKSRLHVPVSKLTKTALVVLCIGGGSAALMQACGSPAESGNDDPAARPDTSQAPPPTPNGPIVSEGEGPDSGSLPQDAGVTHGNDGGTGTDAGTKPTEIATEANLKVAF